METFKINFKSLLVNADQFYKEAQKFEYSADPMKKALDTSVGKGVQQLVAKYLNTRAISSIQININYQPPSAIFTIFAIGTDKEAVEKELAAELNAKYSKQAAQVFAKYQKDKPLDYKYSEYEK